MSEWLHIADRFVVHFFSAYGIVSGTWFFLNWLRKKRACQGWMPQSYLELFVLSAVLVCLGASMREPFDVHEGDWWIKSYFDYASWILGSGVGVWGNYRMWFVIIRWAE